MILNLRSPGVYPVGFNGAASGAPSIVFFLRGDIILKDECISGDLGAFKITDYTFGVYPVGFNGAASGAPSIISWGRGDGKPFEYVFKGDTYVVDQIKIEQPGHDYTRGIGSFSVTAKIPTDLSSDMMNTSEFTVTHVRASDPPNIPDISGPTSGKAGEEESYTISADDPNGDSVFYLVYWGDGTDSGWMGPYSDNEMKTFSHTWSTDGDYTIKAKAKDINGFESDLKELEISMPKTKTINTPFIRFLEYHPHLFPLLRKILGL